MYVYVNFIEKARVLKSEKGEGTVQLGLEEGARVCQDREKEQEKPCPRAKEHPWQRPRGVEL